jgi:hypothetical protein
MLAWIMWIACHQVVKETRSSSVGTPSGRRLKHITQHINKLMKIFEQTYK